MVKEVTFFFFSKMMMMSRTAMIPKTIQATILFIHINKDIMSILTNAQSAIKEERLCLAETINNAPAIVGPKRPPAAVSALAKGWDT